MHLSQFNRLCSALLPIPLEPMPRLGEHLGGPNLWIKRDDCTGVSTGGNKTRKLELLMGDALDQRANAIITQKVTQSNRARQTAAADAKFGMDCHILLEYRPGSANTAYNRDGNVLLEQLHGATLSQRPGSADMDALAQRLRPGLPEPTLHPTRIVQQTI